MLTPGALFSSILLILIIPFSMSASAAVNRIVLSNNALKVEVTPDIGGRLLSVSLLGHENFLKVGVPVVDAPSPQVDPFAEHIGYLAHEMWVGPQSQWWRQQAINKARLAEKAVWPPDPYLVLAKNQAVTATAAEVVLRSPASPVSGVQMEKSYRLDEKHPNRLCLEASLQNVRDTPVSWDIWFNTRVTPETQVYVPVAAMEDVRVNNIEDEHHGPLAFELQEGMFQLNARPAPANKPGRRGKLLIQPSHGWLAGFRDGQAFIIQFEHRPVGDIHPEQGQVELYLEYDNVNSDLRLLELEVHAPYRLIEPKANIKAKEYWTLLPYGGENSRSAHLAFLRAQAVALNLEGL
jgi:hypothetical protein